MPDGGARLGDRIRGWLLDFLDLIGLGIVADNQRGRVEDWNNIRSASDLDAYIRKYGIYNPSAIAHKAKELGISDLDIQKTIKAEITDMVDNPSAWIGQMMQDAHASPLVHEMAESLAALALDPFLAIVVGDELDPGAPEIERARRFLGTVFIPEAEGWVLSMLGQALSLGQLNGLGRALESTKYTLGTCFTTWQTTSPIVQATILEPLQRLLNRTFRPTKFTRSQWMDLYALGKIGSARLMHELQDLGYSGEKIAWLVDLAEKQLSRSDIFALWHKGRIGPIEVASRLEAMGYSRQAVEELIWLHKKEETTEEKGVYLGTLRKAFKEQLVSEAYFRETLKKQGRSQEAIDLEVAVLKLSWEIEAKTAAKSDIRSAYMEDVIGRPEAEHWLAEAGFATHDIKLIVDTWARQRAPDYRKINKAELLQAWGVGVLTRPETYQGLRDVGYDERGATILMDTYEKSRMATKPPETYQLKASDVMWAWHVEVLEENEVLDRLVELGFTEEDAEIVFETFQRLHPRIVAAPTRELKKNDVLAAWGAGVLTREEAATRLVELRYTEEDTELILDTFYEIYLAARPPEPYVPSQLEILDSWQAEIIEEDTAKSLLVEIGLTEEEADRVFEDYSELHPRKGPALPRELHRYDILDAWGRGIIDEDATFQKLLDVGYSEDDAGLLMDSYELRPEALPPEPTISQLVAACRRGVIDQSTLSQKLTTMGLKDEDVQFYVSYAVSPEPTRTRSLSRTDILRLWTEGRHDRSWTLERLLAMNYSEDDANDILWLASPEIEDTETYVLWKAGYISDDVAAAMWSTMGFSEEQIEEYITIEE